MKKWFFSNNGDVTAPLDLDAAKTYVSENPDVYGWHPSFSQWKPVNCISEFVDVVPPTVQAPAIPKEISDKFVAKKQRLDTKLTSIEDSINHSESSLGKLEQQITNYKEMTQNLNDDVKGAIDNIDKKYRSLSRKLSQVKDAVDIAEREMAVVVDDFNQRMRTNDVFMPSCNPASVEEQTQNVTDFAKASKAKLAQEKLATPHKRVEPEEAPQEPKAKMYRGSPVEEESKPQKAPAKKAVKKEKVAEPSTEVLDEAKESFNGMKNMMKSVFKGDSKVVKAPEESKKAKEEPPLSMAERLKMAQNNQ